MKNFVEIKISLRPLSGSEINIIHHNDAASDLTLTDVVTAIDVILEYVRTIRGIVSSSPFSSEV